MYVKARDLKVGDNIGGWIVQGRMELDAYMTEVRLGLIASVKTLNAAWPSNMVVEVFRKKPRWRITFETDDSVVSSIWKDMAKDPYSFYTWAPGSILNSKVEEI
jgi:hypothetical protein